MKLLILALVAVAACAYARTATRQPAVSAHITSLNDKDAKRKAMEHPAFANAGKQAGVEIWRIEDFEPVLVPSKDSGKFYKGDSYIILKTTADKRKNLSWDIHYWLGSATSQDEAGAAAILTVGLDDKFGGAAVQHRETQGHESPQFLSLFQPAIRYLDGGHASGFSHVTTNAGAEKRLFQIKGKRNVRVRQVDPLISSMNKGDVFILDKDQDILVYVGEKAKNVERLKAISVANQIRDQDHNGRGRVEIIDQYSNEVDVQKFFTALGSGSRDSVPEESAGGDDQAFERNEEQTVILSEISDKTGKLVVTPLPRPYKQEQLNPQECYILDTVSGSIYVWVGKQSTAREKTEAMNKAQQYLTSKSYPSWVHVSKIPQGTEPAAFKQYFTTWRDVGMSHTRLVRSASDEEFYSSDQETSDNRARIIGKTGAARGFMPDQGEGRYTVYRISSALRPSKMYNSENLPANAGIFYQGDCYVVEYQYESEGETRIVMYYWMGKDATTAERVGALLNAYSSDRKDNSIMAAVQQGEEPKHLLKIFKGRLVTLLGDFESNAKTHQRNTYNDDGVRLFRISGTAAGVDLRAEQVAVEASSLNSDDVFILESPQQVFVWHGDGSSPVERAEASAFVSKILGDVDFITVNQDEEPEDFWKHLPGTKSSVRPSGEWRDKLGHRIGGDLRVYEATNTNGVLGFDQMNNFEQSDMMSDDILLLDAGDTLYMWVGKEAPQKPHGDILTAFLRRFGPAASAKMVVHIKQEKEPRVFTDMFEEWDSEMWMKRKERLNELDKAFAIENNSI